jgi:uncharacterized protein (DUF885 family)
MLFVCFGWLPANRLKDRWGGVNTGWQKFLDEYYDQWMKWFPLEATANGDNRYNDRLSADFTDGYQDSLKIFFRNTQTEFGGFDRSSLNENDRISYDILKWELEINLDAIALHISVNNATGPNFSAIPFNQFAGLPLLLGQMGSGAGNQPFKTIVDYDQWIKRVTAFGPWADSAIVYFKKGIADRIILPRRYENDLGGKFTPPLFHDSFLGDGSLPLTIIEIKMSEWEQKQK